MRPVLLDRGYGKDRHGLPGIERSEIGGAQILPCLHAYPHPKRGQPPRRSIYEAASATTRSVTISTLSGWESTADSHAQTSRTSRGGLSSSGTAHSLALTRSRPRPGFAVATANGIARNSPGRAAAGGRRRARRRGGSAPRGRL